MMQQMLDISPYLGYYALYKGQMIVLWNPRLFE